MFIEVISVCTATDRRQFSLANVNALRIATWNLERAAPAVARLQCDVVATVAPDVAVFTEVPSSIRAIAPNIVLSSVERQGRHGPEAWVGVVAEHADLITPSGSFERLAVAVRARIRGKEVIVYGSVLPWLAVRSHEPDLVRPDESSHDVFERVLAEQVSNINALQVEFAGTPVLWAGDFNQSLEGPLHGGSRARRQLLVDALASLRMDAFNRRSRHAAESMRAIDLICGPSSLQLSGPIGVIAPTHDSRRLSDHAGYYVDLAL